MLTFSDRLLPNQGEKRRKKQIHSLCRSFLSFFNFFNVQTCVGWIFKKLMQHWMLIHFVLYKLIAIFFILNFSLPAKKMQWFCGENHTIWPDRWAIALSRRKDDICAVARVSCFLCFTLIKRLTNTHANVVLCVCVFVYWWRRIFNCAPSTSYVFYWWFYGDRQWQNTIPTKLFIDAYTCTVLCMFVQRNLKKNIHAIVQQQQQNDIWWQIVVDILKILEKFTTKSCAQKNHFWKKKNAFSLFIFLCKCTNTFFPCSTKCDDCFAFVVNVCCDETFRKTTLKCKLIDKWTCHM